MVTRLYYSETYWRDLRILILEGGIMKVTVREMREADDATLDELYAHEEVAKTIWTQENAESWIPEFRRSQKGSYYFTILVDGKIAGGIYLEGPSRCRSSYSVGFALGREFWGQGICTEALKQVVKVAFDELKIHKLFGDNDSDTPASGRVFEKAGFRQEGVFREHVFKEGRYIDIIKWGLINVASEEHH
jgi:ribosomal-protein-alanine N-acetyltransferase